MAVLHIYATYQPHISYGYENVRPDMSESVISAFKMATRRLTWIRQTQFLVSLGIHAHTKFGNSSLYGYDNFTRKLISVYDDDDFGLQ